MYFLNLYIYNCSIKNGRTKKIEELSNADTVQVYESNGDRNIMFRKSGKNI